MRSFRRYFLAVLFLLAGCVSPTPAATAVPLVVQYTPAAAPWLEMLYACAGSSAINIEQRSADLIDLSSASLAIRIGQPDPLLTPAYQVGSDDLLVIVNAQNPVTHLSAEQARDLFTGRIVDWKDVGGVDDTVQVWVFTSGDDLQSWFDQSALDGSRVTSNARLASSPAEMLQAVAADTAAVGILNRRLISNSVAAAYAVASVPVLVLTPADPPAGTQDLVACMQK